jgi:hypothetical protein
MCPTEVPLGRPYGKAEFWGAHRPTVTFKDDTMNLVGEEVTCLTGISVIAIRREIITCAQWYHYKSIDIQSPEINMTLESVPRFILRKRLFNDMMV